MAIICGADGCKNGWVVVVENRATRKVWWHVCASVAEIVSTEPHPQIIALDIPIGLPDQGPRECDLEARRLLRWPRASSVFPAPIRSVLTAATYEEACRKRYEVEQKKMSQQASAIVPKIQKVDELLCNDPHLRSTFYEVHPEVSFYVLAGHPMACSKKKPDGRKERYGLLKPIFGESLDAALAERNRHGSNEDDLLDAFVALWTAERIAAGTSRTIPSVPHFDRCGLPMRILA
jgi:predicted RNase H-like nuclease